MSYFPISSITAVFILYTFVYKRKQNDTSLKINSKKYKSQKIKKNIYISQPILWKLFKYFRI